MSNRTIDPNHPELEALFQATREVESIFRQESAQVEKLKAELRAARERHAAELGQVRKQAQAAIARDEELRRHLAAATAKIHAFANHAAQLQQANARISEENRELARKHQLELVAARSAHDHLRAKAAQLEQTLGRLHPEVDRARAHIEAVQADALEREHRHQAAHLAAQGRDRSQQEELQALRNQLRHTCDELGRLQASVRTEQTSRTEDNQELSRLRAELADAKRDIAAARQEGQASAAERIATEKHRRQRAEAETRSVEERLAIAEAQLSKGAAEAARIRAQQRHTSAHSTSTGNAGDSAGRVNGLSTAELEMLARLAAPGFPIKN